MQTVDWQDLGSKSCETNVARLNAITVVDHCEESYCTVLAAEDSFLVDFNWSIDAMPWMSLFIAKMKLYFVRNVRSPW